MDPALVLGKGTFVSKQPKSKRFLGVVLETVGGPLFWGTIATLVYYFAVREGFVRHPLLVRYTAGHPVEYAEVALFFIGVVAILRRGLNAGRQLLRAEQVQLKHVEGERVVQRALPLLAQLKALPAKVRETTYARRLLDSLEHIKRHESAAQLEDELKYLSEMDSERTHEGYALVRMIIWATPMLGFLGTVIGITLALGDLSPEALVNSPKEAMEGLLSGLSVAFDTTALALTLSIAMMFAQFLTQQIESQLLSLVDRQVTSELSSFFRSVEKAHDPQVETLRQMTQAVVETFQASSQRQAEVWQEALEQAHQQWARLLQTAGESVEGAVAGAVQKSLEHHSANLVHLETSASKSAQSNWQQWHSSTTEMLRQLRSQQSDLTRHGEILNQVLQATGQVIGLEQALNQNLRALAGSKNFEDTVMSLSAAIHLLSSRLSRPVARDAQVRLDKPAQERAA